MTHPILANIAAASLSVSTLVSPAMAATYLNNTNITVSIGPGTSPGTFNNTFDFGRTIEKAIDAPTADASEVHSQATHIWFTASQAGGGLELLFDFNIEYDLSTLHFWNYNGEGFDVDAIEFSFFDGGNSQVGSLSVIPALGSTPAIFAEDILLAAPLNVRYVTAFLSGDNREVDFQNIGFTASVSAPIPEPTTLTLMALGTFAIFGALLRSIATTRPLNKHSLSD